MMEIDSIVLNLVIFLPLLGALAIALLARDSRTAPRWIAAIFSGLVLLLALWLFVRYDRTAGGFQFRSEVPWIPQIGSNYSVGLDGVSLPLVLLNALLTFLAALISWNLALRPQLYFTLLLVLETAVAGVFSSLDFFVFFLFWELELAPMYLLIGIWGGPRREYAAMKFIVYTILGSAFMLLGILGLVFFSGQTTFSMEALGTAARQFAPGAQLLLFVLLYLGFAVKIPIFPFHTWLPDAHVEAPTPISVLLAGVLLKMGGYGLLRLVVDILPDAARSLAPWLAVLAVINVLYGAAVAMSQRDLKKLIANSSISHMGYVVLGIASLNLVGFQGAVLQMFTHGTITGLLFMMVGLVYDRAHTRDIPELGGGLASRMPVIATVFLIAGLASLGLPGMAGFVAEFLVFVGTYPVWTWAAVLAIFAIVITAGYLLWMLQRVFFGPAQPRWEKLGDASRLETFAIGSLVFVIVLVGLWPNLLVDIIATGVTPIAAKFVAASTLPATGVF